MRVGLAVLGILSLDGAGGETFVLLVGGYAARLFGGADGDVFAGLQLQVSPGTELGPQHLQFIGTCQAQIALRGQIADQHILVLLLAFGTC
ncbi:hypothetical protein D3C80_1869080 [compost metagenome]